MTGELKSINRSIRVMSSAASPLFEDVNGTEVRDRRRAGPDTGIAMETSREPLRSWEGLTHHTLGWIRRL